MEARRAVAFLLLLALGGFSVAALLRPLLRFAAGPESEVLELIKDAERESLQLTLPGLESPALLSHRAHFDRISVVFASDTEATAHLTLDFDGKLGATTVSSLGVERIPFRQASGRFQPTAGYAPHLSAVVAALEARRRALEAVDLPALAALGSVSVEVLQANREVAELVSLRGRTYRAESWHLRLEREGAQVTEIFLLAGALPDRPVHRRGSRQLSLVRRNGQFFFSGELL
jgi:hypothetical protein